MVLIYSLIDRYKRFGATYCLHRSLISIYRRTRRLDPKTLNLMPLNLRLLYKVLFLRAVQFFIVFMKTVMYFVSPLVRVSGCRGPLFSQCY